MDPLIRIAGVHVRYGDVHALRGIDATWNSGIIGIVGPNGAGKSTLFKIVTGSLAPDEGEVWVSGASLRDPRTRRRYQADIGYLPQDPGWFEGFTVLELVRYFAYLRGGRTALRGDGPDRALHAVDLEDRAGVRLRDLSGGQRRRAFIAQAMVHDPRVLVLDEPTAGLDPLQRMRLRDVVQKVASDRLVLLSTHLVEDIARTADDVMVMDAGQCVWTGSTDELKAMGGEGDGAAASAHERGLLTILAGGELAR
ncbi:ABC transporter ATP-binding protein [Isoptericola croceus]|uniref:ABC transporter ATP-binding protein n=1 Tax=Isoptericola croceus TaxID=3031406 RepID=UPI0023F8B33D|nr:ATP-binding cassette domain-containing protein [Isoptericola croceus]